MPDNFNDLDQWLAIDNHVTTAAKKYGVDPMLVHSMIRQESRGRTDATSRVGAQGLMQLMPATAAELGVKDPFDPAQNIDGGTRYLSQLLKKYGGDTQKALMAYNAGMGNVDSGKASGFPETQGYVRNILGNPALAVQTDAPKAQPDIDISDLDAFLAQPAAAKPAAQAQAPRTWTDTAVDLIPAAGATIGGIVGGIGGTVAGFGVGGVPGAIGGAATGGAGGEGLKTVINYLRGKETPTSSAEVAKNIATEGAKQAGYELVGGQIGKHVLKPVARTITKHVFKPSEKILKASPTVVDDALKMGIGFSKKGAATAQAATTASREVADRMVAAAEEAGVTVPRAEILQALIENPTGHKSSMDYILSRAEQTPMLKQLGKVWENILKDQPELLKPTAAHTLRRAEGSEARTVFEGAKNPTLQKRIHTDLETGARVALEKRIPKFADANARTAKHLAVQQMAEKALASAKSPLASNHFENAVLRHAIFGIGGNAFGGPAGAAGALATAHMIGKPSVQQLAARGTYQAAEKHLPEMAPRALEGFVDEVQATKRSKKKPAKKNAIDSLYQRYQNEP